MNVESGIHLDLIGSLRRRGPLLGMIAGGIFLATYWLAMALPNQYQAAATLLIEPQAVSKGLVESGARTDDLNERLNLMAAQILSRPRLSRVIDDLNLFEKESKTRTRQELIDMMRDQVNVVPIIPELDAGMRGLRRSAEINTFQVLFRSESAKTAAEVAQRLANDFIEEHIAARVEQTQKSLDFISSQQERLVAAIRALDEQIAQIKDQNPRRLPEDLGANQRNVERMQDALRDAERDLDSARSDESFWAAQTLEAASASAPGDVASPSQRLKVVELSLSSMRAAGFTEKHPDILRAEAELEDLRRSIRAEKEEPDEDRPLSMAHRTAVAERHRAGLRVETASNEIRRLRASLERVQVDLDATPRVAEQLATRERRRRELADSVRDYNRRQLEASVQSQLERKQLGEQFRILEPAFPPTEPSSPNRMLILLVGLLMGLGLAGAAAVVVEATDSSVHGARDLQQALGMPVLAAIPSIVLEPDRIARRRRRVRAVAAALSVVIFCLVGGAVTYLLVNGGSESVSKEESGADESAAASSVQAWRG